MSHRFNVRKTELCGLNVISRERMGDQRGYLERLFCSKELDNFGWAGPVAQINKTLTKITGTVRGMHFQYPPHCETKLVMCLNGCVFDVAVDIRQGSPTFLCWYAEVLEPEKKNALLIPEGFAHGFQTLTDDVEMLYFHSSFYEPAAEGGLHPEDPSLKITWPQEISNMSARDCEHPFLNKNFTGIQI